MRGSRQAATAAVLAAWLARRDKWRAAYTRLHSALEMQDSVDRERLLNAVAWFEAAPFDAPSSDFSADQVEKIADAAVASIGEEVAERGQRIRSVVGMLKRESLKARFIRLIASIRAHYGADLVPPDTERHCMAAVELRGAASHGDINWDKVDFREFLTTIYALEAVCFLLTIMELPLAPLARSRLGGHPLMAYLRMTD